MSAPGRSRRSPRKRARSKIVRPESTSTRKSTSLSGRFSPVARDPKTRTLLAAVQAGEAQDLGLLLATQHIQRQHGCLVFFVSPEAVRYRLGPLRRGWRPLSQNSCGIPGSYRGAGRPIFRCRARNRGWRCSESNAGSTMRTTMSLLCCSQDFSSASIAPS